MGTTAGAWKMRRGGPNPWVGSSPTSWRFRRTWECYRVVRAPDWSAKPKNQAIILSCFLTQSRDFDQSGPKFDATSPTYFGVQHNGFRVARTVRIQKKLANLGDLTTGDDEPLASHYICH